LLPGPEAARRREQARRRREEQRRRGFDEYPLDVVAFDSVRFAELQRRLDDWSPWVVTRRCMRHFRRKYRRLLRPGEEYRCSLYFLGSAGRGAYAFLDSRRCWTFLLPRRPASREPRS
jgi:hypothetical protein